MGSVDEGDVERQQEEERKEQWAENLESEPEEPSADSPAGSTATPVADAAHAATDAPASNGSQQPSEASNGSLPSDADSTPVRPLSTSIFTPQPRC